jgi:hypothetical protein
MYKWIRQTISDGEWQTMEILANQKITTDAEFLSGFCFWHDDALYTFVEERGGDCRIMMITA